MQGIKRKMLPIIALCLFIVLSGCSVVNQNGASDVTLEDIITSFQRDPKEGFSKVVDKMNTLDSVHVDVTYEDSDDFSAKDSTMDYKKTEQGFAKLTTYHYVDTVISDVTVCNEESMPDFAIRKGWDVDEYCTSLYGSNYSKVPVEDEKVDTYRYQYDDGKGKHYMSSMDDETILEESSELNSIIWTFHDSFSSNMIITECNVTDQEDGGIMITLQRHFEDDSDRIYHETYVLNKEGYVTYVETTNPDSEVRKETYSKFNETDIDLSNLQLKAKE